MTAKLMAFMCFILGMNVCLGQAMEDQSGGLDIQFIDVNTGYSLMPDHFYINNRANPSRNSGNIQSQISEYGKLFFQTENGIYDIYVEKEGYKPMNTFFEIKNEILNIRFNLEPLQEPIEVRSDYIQNLHSNEEMIILGFIKDDLTGKPISNVKIYSKDKKSISNSDANGFFILKLELPESDSGATERGCLIFEHDNYSKEVRTNFDIWPKGDLILRVSMKKGEGVFKEEILTNRRASIITRKKF